MSKADVLLKKTSSFERLALYSDRKAFLQAIAQTVQPLPPVSNKGVNTEYMPGTAPPVNPTPTTPEKTTTREEELTGAMSQPDVQMPVEHITGYKPIDRSEQSALFRVNTIEGAGEMVPPTAADGRLGPQTRKALDAFKRNVAKAPQMDDATALAYAKHLVDTNPRYRA